MEIGWGRDAKFIPNRVHFRDALRNEEAELMKVNSLKDLNVSWKEVHSFWEKKEWGWEASYKALVIEGWAIVP